MIRNWRERIGLFLGSIFGQRSSSAPVASLGYDIAFALEIDRDLSKTLYIKRFVNVEVEQ